MTKICSAKLQKNSCYLIALSFLGISAIVGCKLQSTQFGNTQTRVTADGSKIAQSSASKFEHGRPTIKVDAFEEMKNYLNSKGRKNLDATLQKGVAEVYDAKLLASKNITDIDLFGHRVENLAQWLPSLEEYYSDAAKSYANYGSYLAQFGDSSGGVDVGSLPSDEDLAFLVDLINQGPEAVEQLDRGSRDFADGLYLGSARECANAVLGALGDVANMTIGCSGVEGIVETVGAKGAEGGVRAIGETLGGGEGHEKSGSKGETTYEAARSVPCIGGVIGAPKSIGHAIGENGCGRHTGRHHSKPGEKKTLTEIFTE